MTSKIHGWPNRTLCDVLGEMRQAIRTLNFSYMSGLIEEAQYLGNKMEAALGDVRDINEWTELRSEMKAELKALEKQIKDLKSQLPE